MKATLAYIVKPLLILVVLFWCWGFEQVKAQTTLQRGDVAVIGVNANDGNCTGPSGGDVISLVFFKEIALNTVFMLTDNMYEPGGNTNEWSWSEGVVKFTYQGASNLPKGSVIRIRTDIHAPAAQFTYVTVDGDDWLIERISGTQLNSFNINTSGDQLFVLSDGNWNNNATFPVSDPDDWRQATFDGDILYGFTTTNWCPSPCTYNSEKSSLPPDIDPCFQMDPTSSSRYNLFTPPDLPLPLTPRTKQEWINLISNPTNWTSYYDGNGDYACGHYNTADVINSLPIIDLNLELTADPSSVCEGNDVTLNLSINDTTNTYDVVISDGTNTFNATINNGIGLVNVGTISGDTTFTVIEITETHSGNSCPLNEDFVLPSVEVDLVPSPDRDYISSVGAVLRGEYYMCEGNVLSLPLDELQYLLSQFDIILYHAVTDTTIDLRDEYLDASGVLQLLAALQPLAEEGEWQVTVIHEDQDPNLPYNGSGCSWTGNLNLHIIENPYAGEDASLSICPGETFTTQDLYDALSAQSTGTPDTGGTWMNYLTNEILTDGQEISLQGGMEIYKYTVYPERELALYFNGGSCPEPRSAQIVVTEEGFQNINFSPSSVYGTRVICELNDLPDISTFDNISENYVSGSWAVANTDNVYTYTFTPNSGQGCYQDYVFEVTLEEVNTSEIIFTP